MLDLVLKGGTLVDGSGNGRHAADVGIKNNRIVSVGHVTQPSRREIDAQGLIVSPGFIDVHTHDDRLVLIRPDMAPKISQGVTTVIGGNCGIAAAPVPLGSQPPPPLTLLAGTSADFFANFAEYKAALTNAQPATNFFILAGHTSLRAAAMQNLDRPATAAEMSVMQSMLRTALHDGVSGLSTGLYYPPAQSAPPEEVEALLRVVADHGGLQTTHLRDEGNNVVAAMDEALNSAWTADLPLVVSHLKCASPAVWGTARNLLQRIEAAQLRQSVAFDVYPYEASSTMLRPDRLAGARRITVSWSDPYPDMAGKDLDEIASCWCCAPDEAARRLSPAGGIYYKMQERDVRAILAHPNAMIGSDGLPHDKHPHPRLWGTFPRVLGKYVRELKLMSLEDAIRRMTALPASVFGLADRGTITEGMYADIAVFDETEVIDEATFDEPLRAALGVRHVLVNGQEVLGRNGLTGARPGKVLTREGMLVQSRT
jgi:N-acyl-D-amino-acid deacylase